MENGTRTSADVDCKDLNMVGACRAKTLMVIDVEMILPKRFDARTMIFANVPAVIGVPEKMPSEENVIPCGKDAELSASA
jgi:aspartyl aminopeptidase